MLALFVVCFVLRILLVTNVQITTPSGELLGSILTTRLGRTIYSFRGIRFAEPPLGELRFKPPVPTGRWSGVYNATSDGPACPQPPRFGITTPIAEDCLFLNVYTTKLPNSTEPDVRRPVILFLFPGGFSQGSANSDIAGPQYLMDKDIVLVTPNYRLAALGFISLGKEAPGNNGLKDQVVAMKWTKKNIAAFGGDPDSITLYGYSAGACSVSAHLVSPMSRNLFHKAIMSSCSVFGPHPLRSSEPELARKQARLVGCPDDTPENILSCLRARSAREIAETAPQFSEFGPYSNLVWYPVIEEDYGQERFLTEHPIKSVVEGNFLDVPILAGVTKEESAPLALGITSNETLTHLLNEHWEKYAPIIFAYERDTNRSKYISSKVRSFYLNDQPITIDSTPALAKIYIDALIGFPVNRAVELFSAKSKNPVYYYFFTVELIPGGPYHGEDYLYLFNVSSLEPSPLVPHLPDPTVIETMTTLWTNFAKTGKPCRKWKKYNKRTKRYLDIGRRLIMRDHLFEDRHRFWRSLYPIASYL